MSMTLPPALLHKYPTTVFVETGTAGGWGVQVALDEGYKDIRSIELMQGCYEYSMDRFYGCPYVKLFFGHSGGLIFAQMIADITVPATFWLDAHSDFQDGEYDGGAPLLEELAIIARHPIKTHVLLLDDMRLCGQGNWRIITRDKLTAVIKAINPLYVIEYVDSKLRMPNDILVAHVPVEE